MLRDLLYCRLPHLAHGRSAVSAPPGDLGHRGFILREAGPARGVDEDGGGVLGLGAGQPHPHGVAAGQQGGSARGAEDGGGGVVGQLGSCLEKTNCHNVMSAHWSYLTQAVDVGCADGGVAEASDVSNPEIVHNHQHDIWPLVT